jgi:flagella basal body P-ring formation protein FlgA
MLCPPLRSFSCRPAGLAVLLWLAQSLPVLAAPQAPAGLPTAQDKMLLQVKQWVAQTQQTTASLVEVMPLDARVQVQECAKPLAMDLPFASRETVRVRCTTAQPWQLYLRLAPGGRSLPAGAAAPGSSTAAATPAMRTTVVARHLIQRGTLLQTGMLEEISMPAQGMDLQAVSSLQDLAHAELIRDIPAGGVLRSHDFRRAVLVKQGQSALLTLGQKGNFEVKVRVEALQDGRMGEQIRLKNPESGRLLSGTVMGLNALTGF